MCQLVLVMQTMCRNIWPKGLEMFKYFLILGASLSLILSSYSQKTITYDQPSKYQKDKCPETIFWGEREKEMYGSSVAIWYDLMIVGAYGDQSAGINSGAVYVYTNFNGNWESILILYPFDGRSNDQYGYSVSLDYHTIVIGANEADVHGEDSGAAYLYQRKYVENEHHEIEYVMKLVPEDGSTQDYFGSSVAVFGNVTLVGAWGCDAVGTLSGCAYVWTYFYRDKNKGEWIYTQKLSPSDGGGYQRFGTSVATHRDFIAIGAPGTQDSNGHEVGAVYVYQYGYDDSHRTGFSWKILSKLFPSDGQHYDLFGHSIALWEKILFIGSPQNSILPSSENSYKTISQTGAVYFYFYSQFNKKWEFVEKIKPKQKIENGHFGYSVAVYDDTAVVGSYNQEAKGAVAIYQQKVNTKTTQPQKWELKAIRHPKNKIPAGDYYGYTVSIYNSYLAVGSHGATRKSSKSRSELLSSGAVYLYFGQYHAFYNEPTTLAILELGATGLILMCLGVIGVILIYLEFRGKLDLKVEGTEYELTDLESSHRSTTGIAKYALSYFKPKESSTCTAAGPITRNPARLSPFLLPPSPHSRLRVIDSMDSSSSSLAISSHSVETLHPPNTSSTFMYGPSQQALDESIRMGIVRNKKKESSGDRQ
jgi:hypothetical protein